ncbi:MAG: 30S ribosomal protein S13 [Candidatus Harrisonbacteria bacterium CG10_big_fil_rev_8_21_14_0_10_38_8]|uniref:Small ribosomal subunit protein uS13 n=1 Tax=Candidatus Harrisonbacteria bacterium CG10_big_fil_rev_8_21_14_0_10_38_8 TaxID=1974582 RepID=A0A2M6WJL0_9BACT|nr:MAG: 30S ribosomal protein S13 [Candidatus Harrisonbacteria bacterium CG10_big_fil_rev_8_21_14_0_10_38_8]
MRVVGINIPDEKRIEAALCYIFGVGPKRASDIINFTKIKPETRAKDLTPDQLNSIKEYIEKNFKIEGELRSVVKQNINMLKELNTHRGSRHSRRLPVRGQRTKTNSRTVRGNVRKTAGSGRRKVDLK